MAHKTMVNGTAYEITGGKTLVNGTAYSIKNGKTLVGGTAYEVGFAKMVTVTLTGATNGYVTINGTQYYSGTTLEVPVGTVIHFSTSYSYCSGCRSGGGGIYLNGGRVGTTGYSAYNTVYDHTVASNTTIQFSFQVYDCDKDCSKQRGYSENYIYITET